MTTTYSKQVMENFLHPKNMGEIKNPSGVGKVGNSKCGDVMWLYIKVQDEKIKDIKFKTFGCGAAISVSSMLTTMAKGKSLIEAEKITINEVVEKLGGLPCQKVHCSALGVDALKKAIEDYRGKNLKNYKGGK